MSHSRPLTSGSYTALIVLALALGLRLYGLGHQSLWIDEVASLRVATQPMHDIIFNYRPGMHPDRGAEQAPLALAVMHLFLSPSVSEASARLPSALLGALTVALLYFFARRLFGAPVALLAALFLALSPLHVWYSQEARWYAQWILLALLSYWALLSAWETGSRRAWLAYWLCTTLNVYTFILTFLVITCQGVSVLLFDRRRGNRARLLPRFVLVQAAVGVACAPVLWMIVKTLGLTTGTPRATRLADLPYTFFVYVVGYSSGPTAEFLHALPSLRDILTAYPMVMIFAVVFGPLIVLGVRRVLREPVAAAVLLPWAFGPVPLAFLISLVSHVTYQARYGGAALPALVLLLALGSLSLDGRAWRWGAIAALLVCSLASLANYYWDPRYAKEDVKRTVAHIEAKGLSGTPVAVVGQVDDAVAFYGPALRVVKIEDCSSDAGHTSLGAMLDDDAPLWFVVGRDWDGQAPRCLERLARSHVPVERRHFSGVELWLFKPTSGMNEASRSTVPPSIGIQ
ncbi:MAG: glycosyltransferase family 39 protein [Candidatus Binatia bacterium]